MGDSDKFSKHDVSLGYPKQMHATYSITKDYNYGIDQFPRKTLVHCSGSTCRENSVEVLATTTNSSSERNKFSSNQKKLSQRLLTQLKLWKENLFLQNSKPLKIGVSQFIIQTGASKTGWGAVCQGNNTGKLGHISKEQNISMY